MMATERNNADKTTVTTSVADEVEKFFNARSAAELRMCMGVIEMLDMTCNRWGIVKHICSDMKPSVGIASFMWQSSLGQHFLQTVSRFLLYYKLNLVPVTSVVFINYGLLLQSKRRVELEEAPEKSKPETKATTKHEHKTAKARYDEAENFDRAILEKAIMKKVVESDTYKQIMSISQDERFGKELLSFLRYSLPKGRVLCVVASGIFGTGQFSKDDTLPPSVSANQHDPSMSMLIGGFLPEMDLFFVTMQPIMSGVNGLSEVNKRFGIDLHDKSCTKALIPIFKDIPNKCCLKNKINLLNSWIRSDSEIDIAMGGVVTHSTHLFLSDELKSLVNDPVGVIIVCCGLDKLRTVSFVMPKKMSRRKIKRTFKKMSENDIVKPGDSSFAFMFSSPLQANLCFEQDFRVYFPNTPLVGCFGSAQFGVDLYPGCEGPDRQENVELMEHSTVIVLFSQSQ